ncbi:hypothetical protein [Thauera sp. 63]|uniref:hypothetical protein n=1 Tax=Thauera sp. 63 TaxID=497321 RepID=UPI0002FEF30D|nr:hypothetical protein [Thauera sp. 63]
MFSEIRAGLVLACFFAVSGVASACPSGQSRGAFGWCYPNVGGEVGKTWEKGKKEASNFEKDIRAWIETGKCGGDLCDAVDASLKFGKHQVDDFGVSLDKAAERLKEGKPLDALWHLHTDYVVNTQENAAEAAQRSAVLRATGQIAATVYGGYQGAAAYTAWLTYHATGSFNEAMRAGIISGASAAALDTISSMDFEGVRRVAAESIMTSAVNGIAVAASGGDEQAVREAVALAMTTVVLREGYRRLTNLDLDKQRLKSSTGPAYCLAEVPTTEYLNGGPGPSCLAPPSAYARRADGSVEFEGNGPKVNFKLLDPDRPHVGTWGTAEISPLNISAENSAFMTGVSRLPGWNAMSVVHDELSIQMKFDLLPGGIIPTVATIPPAMVATYIGSGNSIHDSIRDTFAKRAQEREAASNSNGTGKAPPARIDEASTRMLPLLAAGPTERMHLICGFEGDAPGTLRSRTDVLVVVAADGAPLAEDGRICDVQQKTGDHLYALGHAHHQINYCHGVAERIALNRQRRGGVCFASTGMLVTSKQPAAQLQANAR